MKKLFKITSLVLAGLLFVSLIFGAGVYAANKDWLDFTGSQKIETSKSDIDKIMKILEDTHDGKLSAEKALAELDKLNLDNIKKLERLEKDLSDKDQTIADHVIAAEQLKQTNAELNTNLAAANTAKTDAENALAGKQEELNNKHQELLNKQTEIERKNQEIQQKIAEGNRKVAEKQTELDGVVKQRDENDKHVKHLEKELKEANKAAESVSDKTTKALTKAQGYVTEDVDQE